MAAENKKCHEKGCLCATCEHICSRCNMSGRCPDSICKSVKGMQTCELYRQESCLNKN